MNIRKEKIWALCGGTGRLLTVSALGFGLVLPLSAQTSLLVDFGEDGAPVQSGWENGNIAGGTATSFQFEYERGFGNGSFSGAKNVRLTIADAGGNNLLSANRAGDGLAPLED